MASPNGGIIGVINQASFGKCAVSSITASGTFTATNPGTRQGQVLIVSGGGGSGSFSGGGAGGAKIFCGLPIFLWARLQRKIDWNIFNCRWYV